MHRRLLLSALALFVASQTALAAEFNADHPHTNVGFRVTHMVIAKVSGSFNQFEATLHYDADDLSSFSLTATIQTASIDTNNQRRDNHLRSSDFFDAQNHPTITFESTELAMTEDGYVVHGDLTIRGITQAIELLISIAGPISGPGGVVLIGLEGRTTINRHDFNVSWSATMDNGGLVVANDVRLEIDAEFIHRPT